MKKIALFSIIVFLLCVGCGHHYTHPTKSEAEINRDYLECDYEAELAIVAIPLSRDGISSGIQKGFNKAMLIRKCMKLKGY